MISLVSTFPLDKPVMVSMFFFFFSVGTKNADLIVRLPLGAYSAHFAMRKSSNNYIGENT